MRIQNIIVGTRILGLKARRTRPSVCWHGVGLMSWQEHGGFSELLDDIPSEFHNCHNPGLNFIEDRHFMVFPVLSTLWL